MPNVDFQRHSFLGGEVSPSLYERADMDKFGRWFSKAENIRFRETGAFRNRCGFVKVADTKYNTAGQIIKLLAFQFNDEEAFLIELGQGYVRFYRNGSPVMDGAEPYEISSPFTSFSNEDLKYAQAGDTVFIVHPTHGIYELIRLQVDGGAWQLRKFNTEILPMLEENEDTTKTISIVRYTADTKRIAIDNPYSDRYSEVNFYINGVLSFSEDSMTQSELLAAAQEALPEYNVYVDGNYLYVSSDDALLSTPNFSLTYNSRNYEDVTRSANRHADGSWTISVTYGDLYSITSVAVYVDWRNVVRFNSSMAITSSGISQNAQDCVGFGAYYATAHTSYYSQSNGLVNNAGSGTLSFSVSANRSGTNASITIRGVKLNQQSYNVSSSVVSQAELGYTMTATSPIFSEVLPGDCVLVKHAIDAQTLNGNYDTGTYTLGPIKSDGKWRAYNQGNWAGKVQIQYSTDNQQTWIDYYDWTSGDTNQPYNLTTSGTVTADDIIYFRVVLTVTAGTIRFFFTADSFSVNSYYKLLFKNSDSQVVAKCIKNDIGEFSNKYEWRLPAFSTLQGWPQTVGFYQNRLFFGKDYILYGSKSNDFWDFYEPISLQADDPVTMSLLSTKVNKIQNLVTQRSFFTFTGGGEFGIGSEGALTQADKYMKQFSANGSAQCNPVLISDVILFVDKSFNSVRALKYSLESEGYEAPDITLTMRALMEGEKIISTDQIYEEKEALFLSDTGTIWVLKYITDQNVLSWSHWKHAFGKITNLCVVPNGAKHDLYIGVEANGKKWIELLNPSEFMDTVEYFEATEDEKVSVTGIPGETKVVLQGDQRFFATIDENGQIDAPEDSTTDFKVGSVYVSTATLLSPVIQSSEYSHSNYEVKKPFKVYFYYLDSYGFKVGVEEEEKMEIEWQPVNSDIDDELDLTSGKKSVLIPSRFDGSARVSFVQQEPYPMEVVDVLIQTDYGGK